MKEATALHPASASDGAFSSISSSAQPQRVIQAEHDAPIRTSHSGPALNSSTFAKSETDHKYSPPSTSRPAVMSSLPRHPDVTSTMAQPTASAVGLFTMPAGSIEQYRRRSIARPLYTQTPAAGLPDRSQSRSSSRSISDATSDDENGDSDIEHDQFDPDAGDRIGIRYANETDDAFSRAHRVGSASLASSFATGTSVVDDRKADAVFQPATAGSLVGNGVFSSTASHDRSTLPGPSLPPQRSPPIQPDVTSSEYVAPNERIALDPLQTASDERLLDQARLEHSTGRAADRDWHSIDRESKFATASGRDDADPNAWRQASAAGLSGYLGSAYLPNTHAFPELQEERERDLALNLPRSPVRGANTGSAFFTNATTGAADGMSTGALRDAALTPRDHFPVAPVRGTRLAEVPSLGVGVPQGSSSTGGSVLELTNRQARSPSPVPAKSGADSDTVINAFYTESAGTIAAPSVSAATAQAPSTAAAPIAPTVVTATSTAAAGGAVGKTAAEASKEYEADEHTLSLEELAARFETQINIDDAEASRGLEPDDVPRRRGMSLREFRRA